jgi:hypothetical protein
VDPVTAENQKRRGIASPLKLEQRLSAVGGGPDSSKQPYDSQINELKQHILRLESQLKLSEQRSLEMLKKMNFSISH